MRKLLFAAVALLTVVGCNSGELSNDDVARTKAELSKENYEKTMKEQGKTAELEQSKSDEAERKQAESSR